MCIRDSADSSDTEEDPWFGLQSTPALQHEKEGGENGERNDVRPSTPEYFGDEWLPDYIPNVPQPSNGEEMLEDSREVEVTAIDANWILDTVMSLPAADRPVIDSEEEVEVSREELPSLVERATSPFPQLDEKVKNSAERL